MSNQKQFWLVCIFLALGTFIVFFPVVHYGFINYDDPEYVYKNEVVQRGLSADGIIWAFRSGHAANWHPVTWISHMVDRQLLGNSPQAAHFTNLLLHIANTLLLFFILARATNALGRSAMVAALFALHPMHVESVAWISERKDVLSTFFLMLTLAAYLRYVARFSKGAYAVTVIFFALGLMSKPMLVTTPFVLLLLDIWPFGRLSLSSFDKNKLGKLIMEKVPFFLLAMTSSVVTFVAQKEGGAVSTLTNNPLSFRLANALVAYARYLGKLFWPTNLSVFYPSQNWPAVTIIGCVVLLMIMTILAMWLGAKRPYFFVGWFWFLGTLVPVIGIVQVGLQSMADRYSYVPFIGVFIVLVWGARELLVSVPAKAFVALGGLSLVACSLNASRQIQYWRNSTALFEHALAVTRGNFVAHVNLGQELAASNRLAEALAQYEAALKIRPSSEEAHYNLANLLLRNGRAGEAIPHYQFVLQQKPKDFEARNNLANAFQRQGDFPNAAQQFQEAIRLNPTFVDAHFNLALLRLRQGDGAEAIAEFNKVVKLQDSNAQTHFQLGLLYGAQKQTDKALQHFRAALHLQPDWPAALNALARLLATGSDGRFRDGKESLKLAQRACTLTNHQNIFYLDTLAAALAEENRFEEAVKTEETAKQLTIDAKQNSLASQIESHLQQFQMKQPLRE